MTKNAAPSCVNGIEIFENKNADTVGFVLGESLVRSSYNDYITKKISL